MSEYVYEYPRPCLAVDILPCVINPDGTLYFIGIIRGDEPGQGKFAWAGGFHDFIDKRYEKPIEAVIRETNEEILGLNLELIEEYRGQLHGRIIENKYLIRSGFNDLRKEMMYSIGIFETSSEELLAGAQYKRVDWTTAFLLPIFVKDNLNVDFLQSELKAGDDAKSIQVVSLEDMDKVDFAFGHHRIIYENAMGLLMQLV